MGQTSWNKIDMPTGAIGEPPDGPGQMQTIANEVDDRLGVGGAEWCTSFTAVASIPGSRTFEGKLAFAADDSSVWRYTAGTWIRWSRPVVPFTPTLEGLTLADGTLSGWNVYSEGTYRGGITVKFGASTALIAGVWDLPVAPNDNDWNLGSWSAFDSSATAFGGGSLQRVSGSQRARLAGTGTSQVGAAYPFTAWGNGDRLGISFSFRLA